ncbi:MAG: hypothetical protein R3F20_09190 [Planctomycetota bacterium]
MIKLASTAVLGLALLVSALGAQTDAPEKKAPAPPEAEKVLARYVEAVGGEKALAAVESYRSELSIDFGEMLGVRPMSSFMKRRVLDAGTKAERVVWAYRAEVDLGPQMGKSVEGGDGVVHWASQPMMGTNVLEGAEAAAKERAADPLVYLHWRRYYREIKTTGRAEIEIEEESTVGGKKVLKKTKRDCWVVKLTPHEGEAETTWFDVENGLLHRALTIMPSSMGTLEMTFSSSDYRTIEGAAVKQPFRIVLSMKGLGPQVIRVTSVEANVPAREGELDFPAEVKKLLAKKARQKAEKDAPEGGESK